MEYIYAALLLHKLGKEVSEDKITKILQASGAEIDESKVKSLVASLKGVDIETELANAVVASASASTAGASSEKKEEAPKEEKQEESAAGLSSLFG
ncbi:MAG: 50S ribosomal protein L12 [Candidatus Pacearchaeota archaeon]|jgi:large subunit ribosomal protein L12